jgi:hypothetical protein
VRRPAGLLWLVLAGALAAGLGACGDDGPRPEPPPKDANGASGANGGAAPVADPPAPTTPAFRTAAECGQCHVEIYAEWRDSFHGRAMEDPLFLEMAADSNKEECIRCHAPVPLREAGFETPVARSSLREDAVSCLSCHQSGGNVAGPFAGLSGACRPVQDPDQTNVLKVCFPCHNQHDTGNEWLRGPWSPEAPDPRERPAHDCLDCHMPEVERPLVPGGPVRKGRRHTWPGGHEFAQLERAASLEVETEPLGEKGTRIRVFVTNRGAGHSIPTDARHRSFDTYLKVWDARGNLVLDPLDDAQEARAHLAKFQKYYRGSGKRDTQIPPLARVDTLGDGDGYLDLPEVAGGRGEAWLVYRLTPRDALEPESLTLRNVRGEEDSYLARVILRVPFEFGR